MGVDHVLSDKIPPKSKSYGNSQTLTRDYFNQREIELVIGIGEQVAARIRAHNLRAGKLIYILAFFYFNWRKYKRGGLAFNVKLPQLM